MHLPVPPKDDVSKKLLQDLLDGSIDEPQQADPPQEEGPSEPVQDPQEVQRAAERAGDCELGAYDGPFATPQERQNLGRDRALTRRLAVRAADPVAERDLFLKLPRTVKPGQLADLRCLIRHKVGKEKLTDLAREHNEDYDAFAKRIKRLGTIVTTQLVAMGGIFAVLIAVGLQPRPDHPLAVDEPGAVALQEPAVSTHIGETDPMDWAHVLRGEAFRACMNDKWYECLVGLDAARELDPSGDNDPVVAAARKDAMDGYRHSLKPGSLWRPPVVRAYASRASR